MLEAYRMRESERREQGIPPLPLSVKETSELVRLLCDAPCSETAAELLDLLTHRVPPGVDEAAKEKAEFLTQVMRGEQKCAVISQVEAARLLGTMVGGYNVQPLVDALDEAEEVAEQALQALSRILLIFNAFDSVEAKAKAGNVYAQRLLQSWADAEWFLEKPELPSSIKAVAFKVPGETNTDDLSPATDAWSRPDIPLHALSMLKNPREDFVDNPLETLAQLKETGHPVAYVGDVVGTGSSRKSATNSVVWLIGQDIPFVPNKRVGGFCLGGKIAPIFFNTQEDSGALPIECDVSKIKMGDEIEIRPYEGVVLKAGNPVAQFQLKSPVLLDEVRAGGRIALIIGRDLTAQARAALNLPTSDVFRQHTEPSGHQGGFTLAQKMVGRACGVEGVRPGAYCQPKMTTVGSQDTTGPMTRDELKDLACLKFSADLVMQSFCHTAAYPKPVDIQTHLHLPKFIRDRGGVALNPGDGIIHSWLNRMLLPDTVGTGGDSHTRFPLGISFPAGSGLVAFAAATGVMPLDMPESVRVRFKGEMQPGVKLRDLVNAIPYVAIQQGLLTVDKKSKKNIFSGKVIEIEGLSLLKVEQAFELSDATAERSAAGCTIKLDKEPVIEYLNSNVALLTWMIKQGYGDVDALRRRIEAMQAWLKNPVLLQADADADYLATIDIDLNQIKEPIVACPNDPDDVKMLSEVQGTKIDEVFIGSCMTNIGHFRAASKLLEDKQDIPVRLWVSPPTKMDKDELTEEGHYGVFGRAGARAELPGCSLCMGNQARVREGSTVMSTSTRNFPGRLGKDAQVFLGSAELAAVCSRLGRMPSPQEYFQYAKVLDDSSEDIYRYLNFDQIDSFQDKTSL